MLLSEMVFIQMIFEIMHNLKKPMKFGNYQALIYLFVCIHQAP